MLLSCTVSDPDWLKSSIVKIPYAADIGYLSTKAAIEKLPLAPFYRAIVGHIVVRGVFTAFFA